MKNSTAVGSLLLSLALLLVGCASDFVSSGSVSSAATDSSVDSFNETQARINQQMAVDAANAAATQQFNDAMAAAQQTMNNANAEFNQNGLH
jgi:hypothetical protein